MLRLEFAHPVDFSYFDRNVMLLFEECMNDNIIK